MDDTNFNSYANKIKMHMTPKEKGEVTSPCFQICKSFERCDFKGMRLENENIEVSNKTVLAKLGKHTFEL